MKLNEDFIIHSTGEDHILVSTGNTKFSGVVHLNGTAAYITELLKSERTREELTGLLFERYDVERGVAEKDIDALVSKLKSIGAVVE